MPASPLIFPRDFRFGIADADLQVIGESMTLEHEGSQPTMWTHGAKTSGKVHGGDTPLRGIERYVRWKEDAELLRDLGAGHYRTSVSMARLLRPDKSVNEQAVAWYRTYFTHLRSMGLKIYVTLYHWELPQWLSEKGGWAHPETIDFYVAHALAVQASLHDLIDEVFLFNEHMCTVFLGYHMGIHAPFERDLTKALRAGHNLLLAQGRAFAALKRNDPEMRIGTVCNTTTAYARTADEKDLEAQRYGNEYSNLWFLEPIFTGQYPRNLAGLLRDRMPETTAAEMEEIMIGPKLDCLGINYYFGKTVTYDETHDIRSRSVDDGAYQTVNGLGWPVYVPPAHPEGFYDLLLQVCSRYQPMGLHTVYVTENGTAWPSSLSADGTVDDGFRIGYVRDHLGQVHKAIRAGMPIRAYFLWTLMDNYEWQEGYRPESSFGIVHVDRQTMARTPKASFRWYQEVVRTGEIR